MSTNLHQRILSELADCDRCTAVGLADALDAPTEAVYEALVALEAQGKARVLVEHANGSRVRFWQGLQANVADKRPAPGGSA